MHTKKALVVGLGIAGMSAALGLRQAGWTPIIIEKAPNRRTGGYFIGLFGPGRKAADELGVLQDIHTRTPHGTATWEVDRTGRRRRSAGFLDQPDNPEGVLRGDIEAGLWEAIDGNVEVRFGTTLVAIAQQPGSATVTLKDISSGATTEESFDLVIGADGLRSTVRSLVFAPHEQFMRSWNSMICAFQLDHQVPEYDDRDGLVAAEVGRALWVFPFSDRPPTALFTYRFTGDVDAQFSRPPIETLREVYASMGHPAAQHALASLATTTDYLFDAVHNVEMPSWSTGRVMLLGDSAWCLTLYSGMGASSAMIGGAELGKALREYPYDIDAALAAWEGRMRQFIDKERVPARLKHQVFVPSNHVIKWARSALMRRAGRRMARQAERPLKADGAVIAPPAAPGTVRAVEQATGSCRD